MTKDEYQDFALRYKGCGACFPMYHTLSRFEKMWFTAIQKDVAELEKENADLKDEISTKDILIKELQEQKVYWKESSFDWRHKCVSRKPFKAAVKAQRQLTKAKEIIKTLLSSKTDFDERRFALWAWKEEVNKAEQFISEVEK